MATYEIKNYIKLLCISINHFESSLVDETNTTSMEDINNFINLYKDKPGLKIVMIEMDNMEMITFDDVKKIIHNAHVFDYLRHLSSDGHRMLPVSEIQGIDLNWIVQYMLSEK